MKLTLRELFLLLAVVAMHGRLLVFVLDNCLCGVGYDRANQTVDILFMQVREEHRGKGTGVNALPS